MLFIFTPLGHHRRRLFSPYFIVTYSFTVIVMTTPRRNTLPMVSDPAVGVWAVRLLQNNYFPNKVADDVNGVNLGQIGHLNGYFLFGFNVTGSTKVWNVQKLVPRMTIFEVIRNLDEHESVDWFAEDVNRPRVKRSFAEGFKDPMFTKQWHLRNSRGLDVNVTGVWQNNITGAGVTVCVVDDGLEWTNLDLRDNYNAAGSWDLNDNDADPMPSNDGNNNEHGTRCAGEIAAVPNSVCGVGIAYGAKVSGIKILDGKMTDSMEAIAFNKNMVVNDIYSCSWGPGDDGKTLDGPHTLAQAALKHGVDVGRRGYGTVYVVASGNGGLNRDNCNYDGYANSIYTVTIGAVDEDGRMPYYAEECAAMLAVTVSSGGRGERDIVTTDWTGSNPTGCTNQHTGTSAAAPLAAGIIALMLETRHCLTWRDVQYLIVLSSVKVDVEHSDWFTNAVGLHHSHQHGFGLLDAWRLVNAAKMWETVPEKTSLSSENLDVNDDIPIFPVFLTVSYNVSTSFATLYSLHVLEYVQVGLTISHPSRGQLEVHVICPSSTESLIASPRPKDDSTAGFSDWLLSTVRCWGESPIGQWRLLVTDRGTVNSTVGTGTLNSWRLVLHGTWLTPEEFQHRQKLVEESSSGNFLSNESSRPCPPPPVSLDTVDHLSEKTLQVLAVVSGFLFVFALYQVIEYGVCYDKRSIKEPEESLPLLVIHESADEVSSAAGMTQRMDVGGGAGDGAGEGSSLF